MNMQVRGLSEPVAVSPMQHVLHRDYETRSLLQLQHVGAWKYAADKHTEILCCAYAVDDQPARLWLPDNPVPPEFMQAATEHGLQIRRWPAK